MFSNVWKNKIKELEKQIDILKNQIAPLRCSSGSHEWCTVNEGSVDPRSAPYLRCSHCYKLPGEKS